MNCLEYFNDRLANIPFSEDVDAEYVRSKGYLAHVRAQADEVLAEESGANDGTTVGDVLAEMPVDSACGDECKLALDAMIGLVASIITARGVADSTKDVMAVATDCCLVFIRG